MGSDRDLLEDLLRLREAPLLLLGEEERAVEDDLELASASLVELSLDLGSLLVDLGRQTGGPWQVVSSYALRDLELHGDLPWARSRIGAIAASS